MKTTRKVLLLRFPSGTFLGSDNGYEMRVESPVDAMDKDWCGDIRDANPYCDVGAELIEYDLVCTWTPTGRTEKDLFTNGKRNIDNADQLSRNDDE